jgi:hypothetical protein
MDKHDFYFHEKVTSGTLDTLISRVETAVQNIYQDLGITGIVNGLVVTEHDSPADLTVDITAGQVINSNYERVDVTSSVNLDVSVDEDGVTTEVASPGNEKWLSIFADFTTVSSTPRIDGEGNTVYTEVADSYELNVVQGEEDVSPSRPALRAGSILLADILLVEAQTQVQDGDMSTSRRENAFVLTGSTYDIDSTTISGALQTIIDSTTAASITYDGSGYWANGSSDVSAGTVEEALDEIVSDLATTDASPAGVDLIGSRDLSATYHSLTANKLATQLFNILEHLDTVSRSKSDSPQAWHDGFANPTQNLIEQVNKIVVDLEANAGSDRIGGNTYTGELLSLALGSIQDQLRELLSHIEHMRVYKASMNLVKGDEIVAAPFICNGISYGFKSLDISWYISVGNDSGGGTGRVYSSVEIGYDYSASAFSTTVYTARDITFDWYNGHFIAVGQYTVSTYPMIEYLPVSSGLTALPAAFTASSHSIVTIDIGVSVACSSTLTTSGHVAVITDEGTIVTSTSAAVAFTTETTGIPAGFDKGSCIIWGGDSTFYACGRNGAATDGHIIKSTTRGTWSSVTPTSAKPIYGLAYDTITGYVYACGDDGSLYKTVNGGTDWLDMRPSSITTDFRCIAVYNNVIVVGSANNTLTSVEVLISNDGGYTWIKRYYSITGDTVNLKVVNGHFVLAIDSNNYLHISHKFDGENRLVGIT